VVFRKSNKSEEGIRLVELDELFDISDVISLHCPLTEETRGIINSESLSKMKDSAFLINTGRGPLIDEAALASALEEGKLAGAGLDVLSSEPPKPDNPLLKARNCIITPHVAWATREARMRLMELTVKNILAFESGSPVNKVS
jgi:glycerate dehydrogenase